MRIKRRYRIIMWAVRPMRLLFVRIMYDVGWITSLSRKSVPDTKVLDKTKDAIVPLKQMAEKLGLLE